MKPFILVDGSSYLYRAFHALPNLTNSAGQPTGAIYGVINMLRKLLADYEPDCLAVVFDTKGKTFRHELYQAYKAHRPEMPTNLICQIQPLHNFIQAMGLPLLAVDGVEADDVIGSLAVQAQQLGMSTIISSGDKDFAQLVNAHITLINTMNGACLDPKGVEEKFGVPPALIIDYLTLLGDSVDNIPGVPGVGPKTAVKWLQEYGDLAKIVACAHEIKGKVGENLRAHLIHLPLTKQLLAIKQDIVLPLTPKQLQRQPEDIGKMAELLQQLEFKSWLTDLIKKEKSTSTNHATILTHAALEEWLQQLKQTELIAVDTETTSLDPMAAELVGISFAVDHDKAAYVPIAHNYPGAPEQLSKEYVIKMLKPVLENPLLAKVGHNLKYDMHVLARSGIQLQGIAHDTLLESYILNSARNQHSLDALALKHLNHQTTTFADIAGKGSKQLTFNQVPLEQAAPYAAEDADITLQLHHKLWPELKAYPGLLHTLQQIEMPLLPILVQMEQRGICIDTDMLNQQSNELATRLVSLEQMAYTLAGQTFNLGSPKQLQDILYNQQKLPILQKTQTGQPSTAEDVLQELALDYPLPKVILEYRSLSKLKSTYTDRLPEQVNQQTGRVHTSYQQAVASTGRLSSVNPNLQNIPIRTEEGRRIRQAFIASPGYCLVAADYSQIELRIMAHLSQDPSLLTAFAQGADIHRATAAEIFALPLEQVTHDQRRSAKAINFGLIYGMSAFGLAKQLGIQREAAQQYMDIYFQRYPGVKAYMDTKRQQAHAQGYVETLFGRRLYLPEINSPNFQRQRAAERAAINAPMQGTAADIIKLAMIKVAHWLQHTPIAAHMLLQVHDELVFEVAENDAASFCTEITALMSKAADLAVPLLVDVGMGLNWDEAH